MRKFPSIVQTIAPNPVNQTGANQTLNTRADISIGALGVGIANIVMEKAPMSGIKEDTKKPSEFVLR